MIVFWIVVFFNFYQLTAEKKGSKKWVSQQTFGTSYFDRSLLTLLCNGFEGCLVKKSLSKWTRKRCQIASKVNHATNSSTSKQCAAYKQTLHGVPFMLQVRRKVQKSGRGGIELIQCRWDLHIFQPKSGGEGRCLLPPVATALCSILLISIRLSSFDLLHFWHKFSRLHQNLFPYYK